MADNKYAEFEFSTEPELLSGPAMPEDPEMRPIPWNPIPVIDGPNFTLYCPMCGSENLHQISVRVGARKAEDTPGVIVNVEFNKGEVSMRAGVEADYSGRRDDLSVEFCCEQCPWPSVLQIVQHKGITMMQWVPPMAEKSVIHR